MTREYLCNNFIYAANRVPEICDTIVGIDNAMKWGYNHQLGPFETWDAVGVQEAVEVMKKLKKKVPKKIEEMLKKGFESFYTKKEDGTLLLRLREEGLREAGGESPDHPAARPEGAQARSSRRTCSAIARRHRRRRGLPRIPHQDERRRRRDDRDDLRRAATSWRRTSSGMVVGNHAANFSAGANIFKVLLAIQKGDWDILETADRRFPERQHADEIPLQSRWSRAPAGLPWAAAARWPCMRRKCQPCGETYIGLVEVGVGRHPGRRRLQGADGPADGRAFPTA
ncbi:MAG: 3-hydroxyacyl-CoA dehydrogenase family protein [Rhodopseudomonas palustris]|nr:3-hydroxyacyl-CoA dehydrogenase family protein [Rhodopseudomonas palustris]